MTHGNIPPDEPRVLSEAARKKKELELLYLEEKNKEAFSLDDQMDIDEIFDVVKRSVKEVFKQERSGLGLAFSNLPWNVGALWEIWGNYIVMNEEIVEVMKKLTTSHKEFNSFVYMLLTHEYMHSLGYIDENTARHMTLLVAVSTYGMKHPAAIISMGDLWKIYPQIRDLQGGRGDKIRFIKKFDSSATSYIA